MKQIDLKYRYMCNKYHEYYYWWSVYTTLIEKNYFSVLHFKVLIMWSWIWRIKQILQ